MLTIIVGGDGWKCLDCLHNDEDESLCRECNISWLQEVGHMDYSDEFERRLGMGAGAAFGVISVCAMLLNESAGIWDQGEVLKWVCVLNGFTSARLTLWQITSTLAPLLRLFHYLNPVYNIFLMLIIGLSAVVISTALSITTFFMAMNPMGKRHWKHMTPPMYGILVGEIVYLMFVMTVGATVADLAFVLGPFYIGAGCGLGAMFFMRKNPTDLEAGKLV